jgi:2-polyprenyl-3-methyl-5-hydroxy-6-metoxy-1,4-benzoquinol methylase
MDNKGKNKATDPASVLAKPNALSIACPLCNSVSTSVIHRDSHSKIDREYLSCANCDLTFVPQAYHLNHAQEKAIYDCHENNPNDLGYRKFLSRLSTPLRAHITAGAKGLDFGCGPGPTLSVMLREAGYEMSEYDPYYFPNTQALSDTYDFVTSTEVVEHLSQPEAVFKQLFELLRPHGILGIMTKRTPVTGIEGWHYTKDPTHITFYSDRTFEFIAERHECSLELISSDTALFIKKS